MIDTINYKYKFSIVIAIYNVEKYIEEAIESVINQENINFKEDVQIILVNDGSPDNCEEICLKYKKKYQENIVYIKKENGGVSSARNKGLEYAKGEYINFLDPDDKLNIDSLSKVYSFFKENRGQIDIVSIPIYFFENEVGQHILNYKFTENRIVNILEDYRDIQLSMSSCFINANLIKNKKFDETLKYAEDAKLLNTILLEKLKYGVISDTKYWYRKRKLENSATQSGKNLKEWYTDYINKFSVYMVEYSKIRLGYFPKYIQYLVMYDLQWRINELRNIDKVLSDCEKKIFLNKLFFIINSIDYKIILEQRNIKISRKINILVSKYFNSKNN